MGRIEYSSNNSGGRWWLNDDAWKRLEAAGWNVEWVKSDPDRRMKDSDGERWLGALATRASKDGVASMREGVNAWEAATGGDATAAGCPCCGTPHSFEFTSDDGKTEYGPHTSYEAHF